MASGLVRPGEGPSFGYADTTLHVLAGADGTGPFSAAEMIVPAGFRGPIPHAHDNFDESIYVIDGMILAGVNYDDPTEAPAGSLLTAIRGTRHFFSNPFDAPARVLGMWSPPDIGLNFIKLVGAALPPAGAPNPQTMQTLYEEHNSRLLP